MPKSSKRTSAELVHAAKKQIAGILGIADSSVRTWSVIPTFPKDNEEGQLCIRDVCYWYLWNRADKKLQREILEKLATKLGLRVVEPGQVPDEVADPLEARPAVMFKTPMDRLDYQMRLAKFERELRDVVRIRDIEPVLTSFVQKIRIMLESIARTTGHPLGAGIDMIIKDVVDELQKVNSGASRDHGE